jgi:hypothetical protein
MKLVRPSSAEEKHTRTTLDTVELSPKLVASWKSPPFQRDVTMTPKVLCCGEEIRVQGGVVPGVITLGVLDDIVYIVDGQHRLHAFLASCLTIGYADVRTHWFTTMADMANEYVKLNSALVRLRPDDILRGLEQSNPYLKRIKEKCPYIGYDLIRRSAKAPVLSMSMFIRTWAGTKADVPRSMGAIPALSMLDEDETTHAIEFAALCLEAWRRDPEYSRLWGGLNLTLCAWLYRRLVLGERITPSSRVDRFTKDHFRKCLLALSAETPYLEYLVGRNIGERDRSPCYARIKTIFQKRYQEETGKAVRLPQPAWSHHLKERG